MTALFVTNVVAFSASRARRSDYFFLYSVRQALREGDAGGFGDQGRLRHPPSAGLLNGGTAIPVGQSGFRRTGDYGDRGTFAPLSLY